MKIISFWETAPNKKIPPYVALSLASMKKSIGDDFLLLDRKKAAKYIGEDHLKKNWEFNKYNKNLSQEIASIVAMSDFVRMSYIDRVGGVWLDADTIVFSNPLEKLAPFGEKLKWHSEQFFGALPGNLILNAACNKMLTDATQTWGNPGNVKDLIEKNPDAWEKIPYDILNPGSEQPYNFRTSDILLSKSLEVSDFLRNRSVSILKLYNSDFCASELGPLEVDDFLESGTLLAKLFLSINSDKGYWLETVQEVLQDV